MSKAYTGSQGNTPTNLWSQSYQRKKQIKNILIPSDYTSDTDLSYLKSALRFLKFLLLFQWIKYLPTGMQPCFCPYDMHSIKQATAFIQASYYSIKQLINRRLTCNQVAPRYIFFLLTWKPQHAVVSLPILLDAIGVSLFSVWQIEKTYIRIYAFVTQVLLLLRNLYLLKPNWKMINWTFEDISLL